MTADDPALTLARKCAATMYAEDQASRALGMQVEIPAPGQARVTMVVRADMLNGHDICHGGLMFALADSAFAFACNGYGPLTVSVGGSIEFVRPARCGDTLVAAAVERHRGRRAGVWDVAVSNQNGDTVALFRGRSVVPAMPPAG